MWMPKIWQIADFDKKWVYIYINGIIIELKKMLNLWVGWMKESKETISEWMC